MTTLQLAMPAKKASAVTSQGVKNLLLLATLVASVAYLVWRALFTLPFGYGVASMTVGIILLICEIATVIEMFAHFNNARIVKIPEMPVIPDRMYPDVDVLVVTHNEETSLLYKTLNGCNFMKYPDKTKVHVYLCDDGNREEMRKLAEQMGVGYFGVPKNKTAKAGNLNYALKRTNSPCVAIFDSDMIPTSDFLLESVPYFFMREMTRDKNGWRPRTPGEMNPVEKPLGYVQTRQSFYNPDMLQRNLYKESSAPNELDYFYRSVNVSRMASGSAAFAGSNVVFSRQALDDIGGIPWSITEDLATSIAVLGKGYMSMSLDKELAHGLAPEDAWGFIKQRQRWSRGAAFDIVSMRFWKSGLSARAKFGFFLGYLYWWTFVRRFIYIACPILWGIFGIVVANMSLLHLLLVWLPYYILYNLTLKITSDGTQNAMWSCVIDTIQFPYLMWCIIAGTLQIPQNTFHITPKTRPSGKNSSLELAIPHIILAALSLVAIVSAVYHLMVFQYEGAIIILFWLVYNLFALLTSVVYYRGRSNNRFYERIPYAAPVVIRRAGGGMRGVTADLSEGGLAVLLDFPEYLPYDSSFEVEVRDREYASVFQAMVRQVFQVGDKWKCSLVITSIDDMEKRRYLQILYDRNHLLPRVVNMTVISHVQQIARGMRARPQRGERRLPRFDIDADVYSAEMGVVHIVNFNYKYFMLGWREDLPDRLSLELPGGIRFTCVRDGEFNKDRTGKSQLYMIDNWQTLAENPRLRDFIETCLPKKDVDGLAPEEWIEPVEVEVLRLRGSRLVRQSGAGAY